MTSDNLITPLYNLCVMKPNDAVQEKNLSDLTDREYNLLVESIVLNHARKQHGYVGNRMTPYRVFKMEQDVFNEFRLRNIVKASLYGFGYFNCPQRDLDEMFYSVLSEFNRFLNLQESSFT